MHDPRPSRALPIARWALLLALTALASGCPEPKERVVEVEVPVGACAGVPDGTSCDDADPCTAVGMCQAGTCVVGPLDCRALDDACVVGACSAEAGGCVATPRADGTSCDDGDLCTAGDRCVDGVCGGAADACADLADGCHTATCDPATGGCAVETLPDGATCDDGDPCTTPGTCDGGTCVAAEVTCHDLDDVCVVGVCDAARGGCVAAPREGAIACDDGDRCTTGDACSGGVCAGEAVTCEGADACHDAACDGATGACVVTTHADDSACDDGDLCTEGDRCLAGLCAGVVRECGGLTDDAHCTVGYCDPATGACEAGTAPDGRACGPDASCHDGACDAVPPAGFPCDADEVDAWGASVWLNCPCVEGEVCTRGHNGPALGREYCSPSCATDDDCAFADGAEGTCMDVQHADDGGVLVTDRRCVRTCRNQACPGDALCWSTPAVFGLAVPFCADVARDTCRLGGGAGPICDAGESCQIASGGWDALAVCAPSRGSAPLGSPCTLPHEACATSLDCTVPGEVCDPESHLCQPVPAERCEAMCIAGACSQPCVLDADCPESMYCAAASLEQPSTGATLAFGACALAPGSRAACDGDADCAAPERCGVFPTVGGTRTLCYLPTAPSAEAGEVCGDVSGAACASQLCIAGVETCARLCGSDADCDDGEACDALALGPAAGTAPRLCVPTAACDSDADCDGGEVCRTLPRADGGGRRVCGEAVGSLAAGEACDAGRLGAPYAATCTVGYCPADGRCPRLCGDNGDCGAGEVCRGVVERIFDGRTNLDPRDDLSFVEARCEPRLGTEVPCASAADCGGGETCGFTTDREGRPATVCVARREGALPAGAACDAGGSACASGLCAVGPGQLR
ncbi:MAG: hypothetical protein KC635_19595, partial [Myxococcales bacterium]|nr:hypothetical protein [Myxococcales bacterium]